MEDETGMTRQAVEERSAILLLRMDRLRCPVLEIRLYPGRAHEPPDHSAHVRAGPPPLRHKVRGVPPFPTPSPSRTSPARDC